MNKIPLVTRVLKVVGLLVTAFLSVAAAKSDRLDISVGLPPSHIWAGKVAVDVSKMEVRYYMFKDGLCSPGYYDSGARVFYRWQGINLHHSDIPGRRASFSPVPVRDFQQDPVDVVAVTPLVCYVLDKGGSLNVGYYEPELCIFFQFRGVSFAVDGVSKAQRDQAGWSFTPNNDLFKTWLINPPPAFQKQAN